MFGGLLICNTIKSLHYPVRTINAGIAASAAAWILSSGTKGERYVYDLSVSLVHGAQFGGIMFGDQKYFEQELELMKKFNALGIKLLAENTGKTEEELWKLIRSGDTWFIGREAIEFGLADKLMK